MNAPTPAPALVDRYLRLLEVPRRPPSPEALAELTAAQLIRVPFENVSKLVRLRGMGLTGLPPVELHLEGIERFHLGGTCYANNYHPYTLLGALGYEARLCGADMSSPDVHVVIMVRLSGREVLVDGGYGAPFLAPVQYPGRSIHNLNRLDAWAGGSRIERLRGRGELPGEVERTFGIPRQLVAEALAELAGIQDAWG